MVPRFRRAGMVYASARTLKSPKERGSLPDAWILAKRATGVPSAGNHQLSIFQIRSVEALPCHSPIADGGGKEMLLERRFRGSFKHDKVS